MVRGSDKPAGARSGGREEAVPSEAGDVIRDLKRAELAGFHFRPEGGRWFVLRGEVAFGRTDGYGLLLTALGDVTAWLDEQGGESPA